MLCLLSAIGKIFFLPQIIQKLTNFAICQNDAASIYSNKINCYDVKASSYTYIVQ